MGDELSDEQIAAMRDELVRAPVEVVVANHCYGLFELAAVYLSQQPPLLPQASLAIDALGSLVDGLQGRLGEGEEQLKDGVTQLRLAFVQITGAQRAGQAAGAAAGVNGGRATSSASDRGDDAPGGDSGRGGSGKYPSPVADSGGTPDRPHSGGTGADTGE